MDKFLKMFSFYRSMTCVFNQDGDNNANDGGTGDDGTKAKGGGGAADDGKKGGDDGGKQKPQTFELTVDGQKKLVTQDELLTLAQKSAGAEAKFEDASNLRKQAQSGLELQELITKIQDPDEQPSDSDIRRVASIMGLDPTNFVNEYKSALGSDTNDKKDTGDTTANLSADFQKVFQDQFGISPAEAKQRLEFSHQRHIESAKEHILDSCEKMVDKDEIFGKMIIGEDGEVDKERQAIIYDRVAEEVLRGIQDGSPFGAELMTAAAQKVRAYLTKFGIPNKPGRYPVTLGFGPGQGLPIEVPTDTPIKRVNAVEDGDGDNFVKRIAQKIAMKRRGNVAK